VVSGQNSDDGDDADGDDMATMPEGALAQQNCIPKNEVFRGWANVVFEVFRPIRWVGHPTQSNSTNLTPRPRKTDNLPAGWFGQVLSPTNHVAQSRCWS